MPRPRKSLISPEVTPYYHCVSRCVRRAYLCGLDSVSGRSYEHRRAWVEKRILFLSSVMAINVCAYAVMHNHYHVVLYINQKAAENFSDLEVCHRWHQFYKGNLLSQRFVNGDFLSKAEMVSLLEKIAEWRAKLADISTFMKLINEPIARQANAEDQCTGRFWEGRFKSQALLDKKALIVALAYVDLNPVRANIESTPESSNYTSIKKRAEALKNPKKQSQVSSLAKFADDSRDPNSKCLPFKLEDYLKLVDWTSRVVKKSKPGVFSNEIPPILIRLNIQQKNWLQLATQLEANSKSFIGHPTRLTQVCQILGFKRRPGLKQNQMLFT